MSQCPICSSDNVKQLFYRANVPINQNLLMHTVSDSINVTKKCLNMYICCSCGFIYNKSFDSSLILYGDEYNNVQTHSSLFHNYTHNLVRYIVDDCKIKNKNILEIGCGKGYFLKELCENGNNGIGYDPSYVGSDTVMDGRVIFKKQLYDAQLYDAQLYGSQLNKLQFYNKSDKVDVIICRHVIEHIQQPIDIFNTIKKSVTDNHNVRIFIETPCVKWILENASFLDFFYEHCSYFSEESITTALKISGFNINNIKHTFNDQYLWIDACINNYNNKCDENDDNIIVNNTNNNTTNLDSLLKLSERYVKLEKSIIKKCANIIQKLSSKGKISIWGAGAKGVTFVNLFDPERKHIDCVIDINPNKQNCYIPGTGHLIINYQELIKRNIKFVIVMNSNYYNEILNILKESNINITLIDIKNIITGKY